MRRRKGWRKGWSVSAGAPWLLLALFLCGQADGRPRYRQNLKKHYGSALPSRLDSCSTCHRSGGEPVPEGRMPPHNAFGARLRVLGEELKAAGRASDLPARLRAAAREDADGDGAANELEILSGHAPGDPGDAPPPGELAAAAERQKELEASRPDYSWEPFSPVKRPAVPRAGRPERIRNPIDAFLAREHEARGLVPRPEAPRAALLRRVHLDLIGLPPTGAELRAFLADTSPDAYEKVVDRLLSSPEHGERWARHWMDVWRYSDWAGWGNQVRDSQPHVWRWRDWIVESLNADKGYDRMVVEMLAADELSPGDRDALRATGYLVRSFKLLSREAWMQEAVDHCTQAFLGVTLGCARCHDHMYDPLSQREYYQTRAIFEPYQVRLDRRPGQADTAKDGLARAFDAQPDAKTFLYIRGDDRRPDKEHPLAPGVPESLGGPAFRVEPVDLPLTASYPEKEPFVVAETLAAADEAVRAALRALEASLLKAARAEKELAEKALAEKTSPAAPAPEQEKARAANVEADEESRLRELEVPAAEARRAALAAVIGVERLEDAGGKEKDPEAWKKAALETAAAQKRQDFLEARWSRASLERDARKARAAAEAAEKALAGAAADAKLAEAAKKAQAEKKAAEGKLAEAEKRLAKARQDLDAPPSTEYRRRDIKNYPRQSTGRRLAFARWIAHRDNPLAARVAVNHIWLRHFGQALVSSAADFGLNGQTPSHPALLDWLAVELMEPGTPEARPWSMRHLHRLIVTSAAYRMASTPDADDRLRDPDNRWLWRMNTRRLEAEVVRDAVLWTGGQLDRTFGGPELDQGTLLSTRRRSIYYRHAAEKQPEFLKIFDMAAPSECYERKTSIIPQQALALSHSEITMTAARSLAKSLGERLPREGDPRAAFAALAFEEVLARPATPAELEVMAEFLRAEEARRSGKEKLAAVAPAPAALSVAVTSDVEVENSSSSEAAAKARESLVHALYNHNDFVTAR